MNINDFENILLNLDEKKISKDFVKMAFSSEDPEVKGVAYNLILDKVKINRVEPYLNFDECFDFLLKYYEFCIIENIDGEWVNDRYTAAWDFSRLINSWICMDLDYKYFFRINECIKKLYSMGDEKIQICIETAILEHIFSADSINKIFKDWKQDIVFSCVYKRIELNHKNQ